MRAALGIDVGGTKLLACVIDADGHVLADASAPSPGGRSDFLEAMSDVATGALGDVDPATVEIVGIGLGLPGLLDRSGVLHETPNLPSVEEMQIESELAPQLRAVHARWSGTSKARLLLVAENDATCAAAGELCFGAASDASDAVVITLGTGIGAGVIAGGRLVLGRQGFAGEIGHMVVAADGETCVCGGRGCLELYASGTAIARVARRAVATGRAPRLLELAGGTPAALRAEEVVSAAREGDRAALDILHEAARYLAIGFSNLAEILDPEVIVVSGGLSEAADVLIAPAVGLFASRRRGAGERRVKVLGAQLGPRAGAIGAGALALGRP